MTDPKPVDHSVRNGLLFLTAFVLLCAFLASGHRSPESGPYYPDDGVCSRSAPENC